MKFLLPILIWGTMHAFVWAHVRSQAGLGLRWSLVIALATLALMMAPFGGVMLVRAGRLGLGRPLEVLGMLWMGVFFLLFSLGLVLTVYNGALSLAGLLVPVARAGRLLGPRVLLVELGIVAALSAYALFEASHVVTEHVRVPTPKLPSTVERVRVAQISDVHLGAFVGRRRLERIAQLLRDAEPDIIVSTGDLVDADMAECDELVGILAEVSAPLGKYAVTGNHEYYAGLEQALAFTEQAGFTLLSQECVSVREGLALAGVDDETARWGRGGREPGPNEQEVLRQAAEGDYVILLKHRPLVSPDSLSLMDLQISGHTHGGQIFPFTLVVLAYFEHAHGLVEVGLRTHLYTSRGTGTWGPPMRLLNPPEVTVIDIVPAGD